MRMGSQRRMGADCSSVSDNCVKPEPGSFATNAVDVAIHLVTNDVLEQPAFRPREIDAMARIEIVGGIEKSVIPVDAFLLDEGVASTPFNRGVL